ncbi:MAG: methylated-DNA--[protein]-cysteine S-methyltransferase, partial [Thermoguttaceae bacterium]|nr:methylated-DNA--[protein]-cysteine S-methyltransferase [Thermoguttaceae bacterium]
MIKTARMLTPIGPVTLAAEGNALAALWMEKQRFFGVVEGKTVAPFPSEDSDDPVLLLAKEWLGRYFAGEKPNPRELPLAPRGSDFQRRVWELLLDIPYGEVIT